jgi:hypothetical protein
MEKIGRVTENWVKGTIDDFIANSPLNTMENQTGEPAWDSSLVGFASGTDQIWQQYKEYVGAFHGRHGRCLINTIPWKT